MSGKLGRKQEAAIVALVSNRSIEEAARSCNTPVRTLYRWLKDPDFAAAYRDARNAAYGQSIARLFHLSSPAVSVLGKIMLDPTTSPAAKIRAADCILTHGGKAQVEDLVARVAELERNTEHSK
jgi:hypothetical protein